jgi:AcrR family transcriptional regulator
LKLTATKGGFIRSTLYRPVSLEDKMTQHQDRDTRREQILDAAVHLFVGNGYDNSTVDDIAKEAGLSKGSIYWYFKSKLEILFEIIDRHVQKSQAELVRMAETDQYGPEALYKSHRELYKTNMQDTDSGKLYNQLSSMVNHYPEIREKMADYHRQWDETVTALIDKAVREGHFAPTNALHISQAVHAMYDGLCMRAQLDPGIDAIGVIETVTKLMYDALTSEKYSTVETTRV